MFPDGEIGLRIATNMDANATTSTVVIDTMEMTTSNKTLGPTPPYWSLAETIILPIVLIFIMLVSLIGNAMVIISVAYFKDMQRKTYVLIANLAVADFGVSLLCMPFSLITVISGDWIFGDVLCSINGFLEAIFLIASIHGLMYISIHKYFQISKPLKRLVDKRWATVMIVGTWVVAFTVAMAPVVGLTSNEYKPGTSQCGPKFPEGITGVIHAGYSVLMGFLIPWTVLAFCYGFIFRNIRKHGARMQRHSSMGQKRIFQQQKRITTTLFMVMVGFFICWSPFIIFNIFGFTLDFDNIPIWPNAYCYWFGYLNSAINPVIYGWRNRSFKKAFIEIFHCCRRSTQSTFQTENGMVPANGRASSRRRLLYPPITPSSPDYLPGGRRRKFRFERQVSHVSIVGSTRQKVVGFHGDKDDEPRSPCTPATNEPPRNSVANGKLPIVLEEPPAKLKRKTPSGGEISEEGEDSTTSTAHSNPVFIGDDEVVIMDETVNTNDSTQNVKSNVQLKNVVEKDDVTTTEKNVETDDNMNDQSESNVDDLNKPDRDSGDRERSSIPSVVTKTFADEQQSLDKLPMSSASANPDGEEQTKKEHLELVDSEQSPDRRKSSQFSDNSSGKADECDDYYSSWIRQRAIGIRRRR